MIDNIVAAGINAAEDNLVGQENPNVKESKVARFFVSLLWFIVTFAVTFLALGCMFGSVLGDLLGIEASSGLGIAAVALCLIFAAITFMVPFLRKKGSYTRFLGCVLLGDGLWWIYILATM